MTWLRCHVGKQAPQEAIEDTQKLQAPREYFYGWSKEVMKAWRQLDEKAPKKLSIKMQEPPDAVETDTMQSGLQGQLCLHGHRLDGQGFQGLVKWP